jgi:hypothetical protein
MRARTVDDQAKVAARRRQRQHRVERFAHFGDVRTLLVDVRPRHRAGRVEHEHGVVETTRFRAWLGQDWNRLSQECSSKGR